MARKAKVSVSVRYAKGAHNKPKFSNSRGAYIHAKGKMSIKKISKK